MNKDQATFERLMADARENAKECLANWRMTGYPEEVVKSRVDRCLGIVKDMWEHINDDAKFMGLFQELNEAMLDLVELDLAYRRNMVGRN